MSYMNYSPIPTKPMDITLIVRTTNGPSIPILSNSFFDNIPNITSQFNISHVAKQNNVSKTDISKLTKINDGYGMLCDVVLPKFVQERIKYGKITNAFFTRVEVMSIGNILEPMKSGEENNNIMYIGDDIDCFKGVISHMIPQRTIEFTHVLPSQIHTIVGFEHITSHPPFRNISVIYVDVCASEVAYSHTYVVFLLKTLAIILSCQAKRGSVVIKTNMLVFKPILDILYLLSGKYQHMYIVRPFVSEDTDSRFVILSGLLSNQSSSIIDNLITNANNVNTIAPNQIISSVIDCKMSQYFITKVEECNMLIAQKYVEKYDSLVIMIRNYAKDNSIDYLKNTSILRCISWCEKFEIPTCRPPS